MSFDTTLSNYNKISSEQDVKIAKSSDVSSLSSSSSSSSTSTHSSAGNSVVDVFVSKTSQSSSKNEKNEKCEKEKEESNAKTVFKKLFVSIRNSKVDEFQALIAELKNLNAEELLLTRTYENSHCTNLEQTILETACGRGELKIIHIVHKECPEIFKKIINNSPNLFGTLGVLNFKTTDLCIAFLIEHGANIDHFVRGQLLEKKMNSTLNAIWKRDPNFFSKKN